MSSAAGTSHRRSPLIALGCAALLGALSACAAENPNPAASPEPSPHRATLAPVGQAKDAFTYDPVAAPAGATVEVTTKQDDRSTTVSLEATGLQPNRGYAVHEHVKPCGSTGDAAGPHFQNRIDPAATPDTPSTDPAYANPQNEIWLDLRTDQRGTGSSTTTVPFTFTDRAPASVIIHEKMATAMGPGQAGTAGGRLACINLPSHH